MEKKRIALCLHGLASGVNCKGKKIQFDLGYKYIKSELLDPYADRIDVFVHCWNPEMESKIQKLYQPKKFHCHPRNNRGLVLKGIKNKGKYPMFSNLYSYYQVDLLRQEYQKENNMTFVRVIHTRFDIKLKINRSLDTYPTDRLYILSPTATQRASSLNQEYYKKGYTDIEIFKERKYFLDYLFMGNDEIMTYLTKMYFSADKIMSEKGTINIHNISAKYLIKGSFPIDTLNEEEFYAFIFTSGILAQEPKT